MARDGSGRLNWAGLPVIATVARLLCRELTLENEYLRLENRILKSEVEGRIRFTDDERWALMKAALAMGRKLMRKVVTIVKPDTILAWQRRLEQAKWDYSRRRRRGPGRPRTPADVEALVCRLARENTWGYRRISGELKKLGIRPRFLIHDRDKCLAEDFDGILRSSGVKPVPTRYHAPNANAYAERWIRSARQECLNQLILFGIESLRRVMWAFRRFHNSHRPHQGIDNRVPAPLHAGEVVPATRDIPVGEVECEEFLGGLLKSYHHAAA